MPNPKSEVQMTGKRAKERRFGFMLATGRTQVDAYSAIYNVEGLTKDVIEKRASRLANRPGVVESGLEFLRQKDLEDLDSAQECLQDMLTSLRAAVAQENWTAVAALTRLRAQVHGILKDTVHVGAAQRLPDEALVKKLAGDDPQLTAALLRKMGTSDGYET